VAAALGLLASAALERQAAERDERLADAPVVANLAKQPQALCDL
jgi:hypothetical protein